MSWMDEYEPPPSWKVAALEAEIDRMRLVVDAACEWSKYWRDCEAPQSNNSVHTKLCRVVDDYKAKR